MIGMMMGACDDGSDGEVGTSTTVWEVGVEEGGKGKLGKMCNAKGWNWSRWKARRRMEQGGGVVSDGKRG